MAISATPTDYANLCTGRLAMKISPTTSTGITVTADTFVTPEGTGASTWPTGNQVWKVSRKTRTNTEVEFIGVESLTQSGTAITTGTVIRYLPSNGSSLTSQGNGITFPAGSVVELVWHAFAAESVAFKDAANTFTTNQTISSTNELRFNSSATAVYKDGSGNLTLKDAANGAKTLTTLAAAAGTDEKIRISNNDTTSGYLNGKQVAGDGITLTENNDGANETLTVALNRALLKPTAATTLTIASGAVTATQTNHKIDTESAASTDDLDTISGGAEGQIIIIRQANSGRAVVVKNGTGNIQLAAGDFTLSDGKQQLPLQYDGSNWRPWGIVASAWMGQILSVSTTVSGDTSEHDFSKTVSIGANTLSAGSKIMIRALVLCANAGGSNSVTTKVKSGSTTWLAPGAIDPADTNPYTIEVRAEFEIRTTGAGGTMYGAGTVQGSTNTVAASKEAKLITGSTTSIDTTVANVITISGQLGNSTAGNNAILQTLSVQVIPPNSTTA